MQVAPKICMRSSSAFANLCGSVLQMNEYLSWVIEVVVGTSEMAPNGGAEWMLAPQANRQVGSTNKIIFNE